MSCSSQGSSKKSTSSRKKSRDSSDLSSPVSSGPHNPIVSKSEASTSGSSPARSLRTDTLSSEVKSSEQKSSELKSSLEILEEIRNFKSEDCQPPKEEKNKAKKSVVKLVEPLKPSKKTKWFLRKKAKSIESISVVRKTEKEDTKSKPKKGKNQKTKNKKTALSSILKNPNRSGWTESRPVSSSSAYSSGNEQTDQRDINISRPQIDQNQLVHASKSTKQNISTNGSSHKGPKIPTLSGFPNLQVTHLPSTSSAHLGAYSAQSADALSIAKDENLTNEKFLSPLLPPPPPAPTDPNEELLRHTFYIKDNGDNGNSDSTGCTRIFLGSTYITQQSQENATYTGSAKYDFEPLSRRVEEGYDVKHFEPQRFSSSVNNTNNGFRHYYDYYDLDKPGTSRDGYQIHEQYCCRLSPRNQRTYSSVQPEEKRFEEDTFQPSTSRQAQTLSLEERYPEVECKQPQRRQDQSAIQPQQRNQTEQRRWQDTTPQRSSPWQSVFGITEPENHFQREEAGRGEQTRLQHPHRKRLGSQKQDLKHSDVNPFWRRDTSEQILLDSPKDIEDNNEFIDLTPQECIDSSTIKKYSRCTHRTNTRRNHTPPPRRYREEHYYTEEEYLESPRERRFIQINPSPEHVSRKNYRRRYSHMKRMGSLEDHERKVIIEFCHLLEKSKQLFNGLRELPQYGHKQWHSYFGRTFDVYTKLWKFQQQHRAVLDNKYGLKRWQIGEIASKIGQLYYHFYLRTSETAYLNEAFSFYYAIRGRSYYTKACKEDKCELMVKKLRYYARFIVVCLLLKKIKLVRELIKELDRQIVEYGNTYDPDDQIEWTVVVDEVKAFVSVEPMVSVIHPDNFPVILSHRLSAMTTPPVERTPQMTLTLQEVLIVGSSSQQVKFSELTMDMFRMLQTLEREPTGEIQHMYDDSPRQRFNLTPSALNNKGYNLETGASRCENPHKYLLFKPSPSQILVYLASGCNDLPPNGALLLYISADGQIVQPSKHPEDVGYENGGLITTSKTDLHRECSKDAKASQSKYKEQQCLHPGDLYPFTRRPLFIIIDSDNSNVFQNIPRHFGQPLVILMSPLELPSSLNATTSDRRQQGSLFTLFLHSPLTAFCQCSDIHSIPLVHWDRAQSYIDTFLAEASQIVTRSKIDTMFLNFMGDDFLRLLILRFIFCEVVLRMHRAFRTRSQLTRSSPCIPDELLEHPALTHIIMDLASHLQVRAIFTDPSAAGPPPPKE